MIFAAESQKKSGDASSLVESSMIESYCVLLGVATNRTEFEPVLRASSSRPP